MKTVQLLSGTKGTAYQLNSHVYCILHQMKCMFITATSPGGEGGGGDVNAPADF